MINGISCGVAAVENFLVVYGILRTPTLRTMVNIHVCSMSGIHRSLDCFIQLNPLLSRIKRGHVCLCSVSEALLGGGGVGGGFSHPYP